VLAASPRRVLTRHLSPYSLMMLHLPALDDPAAALDMLPWCRRLIRRHSAGMPRAYEESKRDDEYSPEPAGERLSLACTGYLRQNLQIS
jgi:hypothetical protein